MIDIEHWLDWAVSHRYILEWTGGALFGTKRYIIKDTRGVNHVMPDKCYKDFNAVPTWIFGIWLDTDILPYDKTYTKRPLRHYATVKDEVDAINQELDIYRGVVPTPKGYRADPARVKQLMQRLAELTKRGTA